MDVVNRNIGLFRVWPFTEDAARTVICMHNCARLGRTIQTVDLMVAATALTLGGCTVVTSDSDLSGIPGLNVENWATDGWAVGCPSCHFSLRRSRDTSPIRHPV